MIQSKRERAVEQMIESKLLPIIDFPQYSNLIIIIVVSIFFSIILI